MKEKGRLGEQALTLGSLIFTVLKNALFTRETRSLYTVYCDEIQNLIAYGSGIETVLSEARKFGVAVVSANQFLDQYPAEMRAAILAMGTHVFFQLTSMDYVETASRIARGVYVLFFPAAALNLWRHSLHWKSWRTLKRFKRLPFLIVNFELQ